MSSIMTLKSYGPQKLGKMGARPLYHHWTARDYVQNGLEAMWDGIENAGWGVHDPATGAVWKDLIGGPIGDATLRAGVTTWTAKGPSVRATIDRWAATIRPWIDNRTDLTVEAVISPTGWYTSSNVNRIITSTESGGIALSLIPDTGGYRAVAAYNGSAYTTINAAGPTDAPITAILSRDSTVASLAVNGAIIGSASVTSGVGTGSTALAFGWEPNGDGSDCAVSYGGVNGVLNCVRIYSRALPADEIAANYAVDKARFNLP